MFFVSIKSQTSAHHVDRQTSKRSLADNACSMLFKREETYLTLFGYILKILSIPEMCGVDATV